MYAQFIVEDGSGQQHLPYFSCNDLPTYGILNVSSKIIACVILD